MNLRPVQNLLTLYRSISIRLIKLVYKPLLVRQILI